MQKRSSDNYSIIQNTIIRIKADKHLRSVIIFAAVLIIGTAARFWVARHGHNFDLNSYNIVASITDRGGNVYVETHRYNYGPIWFELLHLFSMIAHHTAHYASIFRVEIKI